ncbi:MAG TPA: VOC family protein [Planctomycetota bacterium]|nr:VOC family protein [Planctomycetota bacterium]
MEDGHRFDHAVLVVEDLARASRDFESLGFTVVPGGEHPSFGSRNALIAFSDGAYLELLAFDGTPRREFAPGLERIALWRERRGGLADFAVLPLRIEEDIARAEARGLAVAGPFAGGRLRPDGRQVAWQLGLPQGFDVPFLCEDVTPRHLRVPDDARSEHPNGASGIRRILVLVRDLKTSLSRYGALLGDETVQGACAAEGSSTTLAVGRTAVALLSPSEEDGRLLSMFHARGEGPFSLHLSTSRPCPEHLLDPSRTSGAEITLGSRG